MTYFQSSGKHHKIVRGIGLSVLFGPMDLSHFQSIIDFITQMRMKNKNDHFWEIIQTVIIRGFKPNLFLFDSWYSGSKIYNF